MPPPPTTTETFKVEAYVDDVKPAFTSLADFGLVDRGSAIFKAASGCVLHRDPSKGKVKFLPIGGWMEAKWYTPWPSKSGYSYTIHCPFQPPRYGGSQVMGKLLRNLLNQWWQAPRHSQKRDWPLKFVSLCISPRGVPASTPIVWAKYSPNAPAFTLKLWILQQSWLWLYQNQLVKPEDFTLYIERADGGLGLIHSKVQPKLSSLNVIKVYTRISSSVLNSIEGHLTSK